MCLKVPAIRLDYTFDIKLYQIISPGLSQYSDYSKLYITTKQSNHLQSIILWQVLYCCCCCCCIVLYYCRDNQYASRLTACLAEDHNIVLLGDCYKKHRLLDCSQVAWLCTKVVCFKLKLSLGNI